MKTFILKAVLPCLALLVLVSGRPFENTDPGKKEPKIYSFDVDENGKLIKKFDDCIGTGPQTLCVNFPAGYNYARLNANFGFTVTSTNPVYVGGAGSHCWSINVNQIVEFNVTLGNNGTTWLEATLGSCIKACGQPEECE